MNENNNVPTKETEVKRVMSNLAKAVECLTQSVEAIEARLTGITNNELKKESSDKVTNPMYSTLLAQEINKIHDKVQILRERLDDLLNSLEL